MVDCSPAVKIFFTFINGFIEVEMASRSFVGNLCEKKGFCSPFVRGKLEGKGRIKPEDELFLTCRARTELCDL